MRRDCSPITVALLTRPETIAANGSLIATTKRRRLRLESRKLLDNKVKARAKASVQAADQETNEDDNRAQNKGLFTEPPLRDSIAYTQLDTLLSNLAHPSVSVAAMDDLATTFELMAIAENTADTTNTLVMAVPKHQLRRKSPFLKLPPEIRCFIYEQVFMDVVEEAEAMAFVRQSEGRAYQSVLLRGLVNALPHTCRIVRKECAPIYEKLSLAANNFRICQLEDLVLLDTDPSFPGSPWDRSQKLEDFIDEETDAQLAQGLGSPWDESQVAAAVCFMRAVGDIDRVVMRIEKNIADNIAKSVAKKRHRRATKIIYDKTGNICIGVQDRLHDGEGLRTAVKAEVLSHMGVKCTDHTVKRCVRFHLWLFSNLKIAQRLDKRAQAPQSGRVLKSRWPKYRRRDMRSYWRFV